MNDSLTDNRLLHLDFSTGASGDKILGALLAITESLQLATLADLQNLAVTLVPGLQIERQIVNNGGIVANHLSAREDAAPTRSWSDIRGLIQGAATDGQLSRRAEQNALRIFAAIAAAEAAVHGQAVEDVHFHEVGAADSILDVVGCCFLLDRLAPQAVYATPLVLGYGSFSAAHGQMSVPAPATARLITGLPVLAGPFEGEMTTPTGAALAAALVTDWQPLPTLRPLAVGYGAGTRNILGAANVVRALLGAASDALTGQTPPADTGILLQSAVLIETNIDHRTPEALAFACEELLAAGALDVWQQAITMKKGRLAVRLSLLAQPDRATEFSGRLLALTGSLGVRLHLVERLVLPRRQLTLETPWGPVRYKAARYQELVPDLESVTTHPYCSTEVVTPPEPPGADAAQSADRKITAATAARPDPGLAVDWLRPEYDEVARLAREQNLDFQTLYSDLLQIGQQAIRGAL